MFGQNLKKMLVTTTAAGALVLGLGVNAASADIIDGWRLNLSDLTGGTWDFTATGAPLAGTPLPVFADATDIDHLTLSSGRSTVTQQLVGGLPFGQDFEDVGTIRINPQYDLESVPGIGNLATGITYDLFFTFDLEGIFNGDSTITFDECTGCINLYLANDFDQNLLTGSYELLGTFNLIDPSGGSDLNFFGGAGDNATIDITLERSGPAEYLNLYADSANNPLPFLTTLHLGNVDALIDENFVPNPEFFGLANCDPNGPASVDPSGTNDISGCTHSIAHLQNAGQYNVNEIPEPGTLALLGAGLLGLGYVVRRRKPVAKA